MPGFGASGSALRAVPACPQVAEIALFGVHFPAVQGLAQLSPPSLSAFVSKPLGSWIFSFKSSLARREMPKVGGVFLLPHLRGCICWGL